MPEGQTKNQRLIIYGLLIALTLGLIYCFAGGKAERPSNMQAPDLVGAKKLTSEEKAAFVKVTGQTVYVPVYSQIYHQNNQMFNLTATLSIRNTDQESPIVIGAVKYFDTTGKLVRTYVDSPLLLPKMATLEYIVGEDDIAGGSGANFIVEWMASGKVCEPIIEAIMIGTSGQQGLSFLSIGKAVR